MAGLLILKGGGYGIGWRAIIGVGPRRQHWTGTNDLPRPLVPPADGGLQRDPAESLWSRFSRWLRKSYYALLVRR